LPVIDRMIEICGRPAVGAVLDRYSHFLRNPPVKAAGQAAAGRG
jgi:hypothetical protein